MIAGVLALAAAAALTVGASPAAAATPAAPTPQLQDLVTSIDGTTANPAAPRYRDLRKLDSHVQALASDRIDDPSRPPATADTSGLTVTPGGRVMVDVYVDGPIDAARRALQDAGLDIVAVSDREPQRMVSGWLPAASAPDVAALDATQAVVAVPAPETSAGPGSVVSQGDAKLKGPEARASGAIGENKASGAGVTVGVISDSFNRDGGMAAAQASSDLPANVSILQEGPSGDDEGRAMAELVYDTAPDVPKMIFATGFGGTAASKANNIDALVAAGAKIITDDVTYPGEPFFQDGVVEQAVDRARAAGVLYFAAAGNSNDLGWDGTYRDAGSGYNDFDPSAGSDTTQNVVSVPASKTVSIMLQWDEAWGAATDTFAATLAPSDASIASSTQSGGAGSGGIPRVYVTWKNTALTTKLATLRIQRTGGVYIPHLKYMLGGDYSPSSIQEYATASPTVGPDAAGAAGALTTAAVRWSDVGTTNLPEYFSSRGPLTHYFDKSGNRYVSPLVRNKPELAAPDGGNTSVPGFAPFYGTSAASPAAAGIAALLWSASPNTPIAKLISVMTDPTSAIDCLPVAGWDDDCGSGLLRADLALHSVDRTPPVVTPTSAPVAANGVNGWYTGNVTVTWSTIDPDSAVTGTTACGSTTVTTDGTTTLTCAATSEAGTTSVPVTIRRDSTPPSAPTFSGITSGSYNPATLPPAAGVGCSSSDPVSGLASCTVTGYDPTIGVHLLTATAVNGAGLTSTASLAYTVSNDPIVVPPPPPPPAKPVAASGLTLGSLKLATLRTKGLSVSVKATLARTRLVVTLTAKLPGARKATVGTLTKTVSTGKQTVRVKLVKKARDKLKKASKVTITVAVAATATGATKATLKRSLTVRR